MADYLFLLDTRLSPAQQSVVRLLQQQARAAGLNLYLTGGPMRDLLLGRRILYLNFNTEGSPLPMAKTLQAAGAESLHASAADLTLRFNFKGNPVRVAAARVEIPGKAGKSQTVPGTIVEELRRRGLTLNSVGLSLNPNSLGLLLDPANGLSDIDARLIRMNQPYIFLDQPVTLLRAVRLRARLDFAIEERTAARMAAAREGNYLAHADRGALGAELEAIAYEPDPALVLGELEKEKLLEEAYGQGVRLAKMKPAALREIAPALENWEKLAVTGDAGLLALPSILGHLPPPLQTRLSQLLPSRHLAEWKNLPREAAAFEKKLMAKGVQSLLDIHDLIHASNPDAVVHASLAPSIPAAGKKLKDFLAHALVAQQRLPRLALRAAGIEPLSEEGSRALDEFYRRLLAGEWKQDSELAEAVRQRILVLRPPPPPPEPRVRTAPKPTAKAVAKAVAKAAAAGRTPTPTSPPPAPAEASPVLPKSAPSKPVVAKSVPPKTAPKRAGTPTKKPTAAVRAQPKQAAKSKPKPKGKAAVKKTAKAKPARR